jgi:subtilisin family serine protease
MKGKAIMAILVAALVLGSVAASMAQLTTSNTEKVKVIPEELSDIIEERTPLEEKEIDLTIGEPITKEILYEKMRESREAQFGRGIGETPETQDITPPPASRVGKIDSALAVEIGESAPSEKIRVIIKITPISKQEAISNVVKNIESKSGEIRYTYSLISAIAAEIPANKIEKIASLPEVERVYLDQKVFIALNESREIINAEEAWDLGYDGSGIKVAVIDTGIDKKHPDLFGKVIAEKDFSDDRTTEDLYGHGTHCAGIIAGSGSASSGKYAGVAPGASLINAKVLNRYGYGYWSDVIAGIEWSVDEGADVISMSLGGWAWPPDGRDPCSEAVNAAVDEGVVAVVAAANSGPYGMTITTPGLAEKAITVGATTKKDSIVFFSSRGPTWDNRIKPEVSAPGVEITSARSTTSNLPGEKYTTEMSGTSMSTPHVAGLAAILRQEYADAEPEEIKAIIIETAKDLGYDANVQGSGRIDALDAVSTDLTATPCAWNTFVHHKPVASIKDEQTFTITNRGDLDLNASIDAYKWETEITETSTFEGSISGDESVNYTWSVPVGIDRMVMNGEVSNESIYVDIYDPEDEFVATLRFGGWHPAEARVQIDKPSSGTWRMEVYRVYSIVKIIVIKTASDASVRGPEGVTQSFVFNIDQEDWTKKDWGWITFSEDEVSIPAHNSTTITATVSIPEGQIPGEYSGMIEITPEIVTIPEIDPAIHLPVTVDIPVITLDASVPSASEIKGEIKNWDPSPFGWEISTSEIYRFQVPPYTSTLALEMFTPDEDDEIYAYVYNPSGYYVTSLGLGRYYPQMAKTSVVDPTAGTYTAIVEGYLPSGFATFEGVFGNSQLKLTPRYWFDWVVGGSRISKDYRIENNGELTTDVSVMASGEITNFTNFDETDVSIAPWDYIDIKATQNIPEDALPGLYKGYIDVFDESIGMNISSKQYTSVFVEEDIALMDGMASFDGSTKDWGQSIYHFDVTDGNTELNAEINWDNGVNDIDLYLVDPNGYLADASIAWRSTHEEVSVEDPVPGKWTIYVEGFWIREELQEFTGEINALRMAVSPSSWTGMVEAGESVNETISIENVGDEEMNVSVYATGDIAPWMWFCPIPTELGVYLPSTVVSIPPGETIEVSALIDVSSDQKAGTYTGDIVISGIGKRKIQVTAYVIERIEFVNDVYMMTGDIGEGDYLLYRFSINDTKTLNVLLEWKDIDADLDMFLYSPDGNVANFSAQSDTTSEYLSVENPENGDWTLAIYGYEIAYREPFAYVIARS